MSRVIIIGKPYIVRHNVKTWLCANISIGNKEYTPYFEVEKEFESFLCTERSDAFLVICLTCAMKNNFDIVCHAPVTDTLYYNLSTYLIPTVSKVDPIRHNISISAPIAKPLENEGAVATGFSGGVDGWYTVLKTLDSSIDKFKLTHVLYHNSGCFPASDSEIAFFKNTASILGLKSVYIRSNFFNLMNPLVEDSCDTIEYVSYPFALQKLFHVFHFSSDIAINIFTWNATVLTSCLSTECLIFYYTGMEAHRRIDKIKYIFEHRLADVVRSNFRICNDGLYMGFAQATSCRRCNKCLRTMFSMYALGLLDGKSAPFHAEHFLKNVKLYWKVYSQQKMERKLFLEEIVSTAALNKIALPLAESSSPTQSVLNFDKLSESAQAMLPTNLDERNQKNHLTEELRSKKMYVDLESYIQMEQVLDPGWAQWETSKMKESQGDIDGALTSAFLALEIEPELLPERLRLANLLCYVGREEEARRIVSEGIQLDSFWRDGYIFLSKLHIDSSQSEAAVQILEAALEHMPHDTQMRTCLAELAEKMGDSQRAIDHLRKGIEMNPDWCAGYVELADVLNRMHRRKEAIRVLTTATLYCTPEKGFFAEVAARLCKLGERKLAKTIAKDVLDIPTYVFCVCQFYPSRIKSVMHFYRIFTLAKGNPLKMFKIVNSYVQRKRANNSKAYH